MPPPEEAGTVLVDGRRLRLTNLDKVLYPETGTTKAEVLAYYAEIAPLLIKQTTDRPTTRKRWPDGVGASEDHLVFFVKNLEAGAPEWIRRVNVPHKERAIHYPLLNDLATVTWMAQMAALEIHVPQWKFDIDGRPLPADRLVLDLDPGPGVGLVECAEVARSARALLHDVGMDAVPVTSGSKGIHLYAAFDEPRPSEVASKFARDIARTLEAANRDRVTSVMRRDLRDGKVFVDWSQNNAAKTTIAPYSLRGRHLPTVAAPRTWEELENPHLQHLLFEQVLERTRASGDLFEAQLTAPPEPPEPEPLGTSETPEPGTTEPGTGERESIAVSGPTGPLPERVEPMLAVLSDLTEFPDESGWGFEMKWDGVRIVACLGGGEVRLYSRKGRDDTATYPEVVEALRPLADRSLVLDGEVVAVDEQGRPRFGLLQNRINLTRPGDIRRASRTTPARLMLFDIMQLDGQSVMGLPYEERRELVTGLIPAAWGPQVQVPPSFESDFHAAMEASKLFDLEGVVAKRRGSSYQPGRRTGAWLKLKNHLMQEVVVGGWRAGGGRREGTVGALYLGVPDEEGIRYVGRVGTGFSDRALDEAMDLLADSPRATSPFHDVPPEDAKDAHWVEPLLVGEVEHEGWSNQQRLWHPSWRGWRPDKDPADVQVEA
ncbi:MAG: ligase [Propionibacteriaceae bacterium]|jgi:bifunctional non-homologous end joining protein LigD|nr:ligase [Propionibacteriaceae bacterium]